MLVAIIGIDGSGKTTQVELLKNAGKYSVSVHKAVSEDRSIIESIACENYVTYQQILSVAMTIDMMRTYRNDLNTNDIATLDVWDRYKYCIQAYFAAKKISCEKIDFLLKELPTPDLTVLLKINPEVAAKRILLRGEAKPWENVDFLKIVQQHYIEILQNVEHAHIIDCNDKSSDEIHQDIMKLIENLDEL